MNQKTLQQPNATRKLPLEGLFLAIVLVVGLAGIWGMFLQPDTHKKPEWKQAHVSTASTYVHAE